MRVRSPSGSRVLGVLPSSIETLTDDAIPEKDGLRLRARLRALCRQIDPTLAEGVYLQFRGPQYETPAEVRMAGVLGADLVGMSTTLEAIAAREAGMEILGLSLVTNLAAGMTGEALNHEEVLEAGKMAAERMGGLLATVVGQL